MTVTPAALHRGEAYDIVPEGFGEEPTKYQLSADPSVLVSIKFPTIAAHRAASEINNKVTQLRNGMPDAQSDGFEEAFAAIEPQIRQLQYQQMRALVNQEPPPFEDCFAPMVQKIVLDFLSVLTTSYDRG